LDAENDDFFRLLPRDAQSREQVCETELVHASAARHSAQFFPFQADQGSRRCADIHGVDDQQASRSTDMIQQHEAQRPAIEQLHIRRDTAIRL
jgi:hypothetical protein